MNAATMPRIKLREYRSSVHKPSQKCTQLNDRMHVHACPLSPSSTVLVSIGVARACMHAPALTSVCMYASASAGSVNGCAACVSTPDGVVVNTSSRDQLQTLASLQDECVLYMHESRTN